MMKDTMPQAQANRILTIIEANAEGIKCKNYQFAQTGLRPSCTSKLTGYPETKL
jgi:hypothetical protein